MKMKNKQKKGVEEEDDLFVGVFCRIFYTRPIVKEPCIWVIISPVGFVFHTDARTLRRKLLRGLGP